MGERVTDARLALVRLRVTRDRCGRPCLEALAPAEWGRKVRKGEVEVAAFVAERWLQAQAAWWRVERELSETLGEIPPAPTEGGEG